MMNDTETTLEGHVDCHVMLRDCVHRRGHEGSLESDSLGNGRLKRDNGGREADVAGKKQEIVVGEPTADFGVHEIFDAETIALFVLVEEGGSSPGRWDRVGHVVRALGVRLKVDSKAIENCLD